MNFSMNIHPVDGTIVIVYLLAVLAFGLWIGRGQKSSADYFLGGRSLPWGALLLSIVATETSTVTFLSLPGIAAAKNGNLTFLQITIGYIIGRLLIIHFLLPLYFRGEIFTAYAVLESRFGKLSRRAASVLFLGTRNVSDALRLFLTALVLQIVLGLDLTTSVIALGTITIIYTLVGGAKSVIWNDVIQFVIYMLGALAAFTIIIQSTPGGLTQLIQFAEGQDKLRMFDFEFSLTKPTNGLQPSFLILAIFNAVALLLTVIVIGFLVRYIMRSMTTDFEQVKSLLNSLAEGEPLEAELTTPRLRETAEVFPAITHINRNFDKKQQLLEHQELNDNLTGLSNRRQFNIEFARAYDFARRGTPVCVVLMRITNLEKLDQNQVNQVVKVLSKTLKEHSRKVDLTARLDYGEFALLMFGASPEGTAPCLERLCRSFRKHQMEHPVIPKENICPLYCGYTRIHAHRDKNAAVVLKRAETALAEAQESSDRHIISA